MLSGADTTENTDCNRSPRIRSIKGCIHGCKCHKQTSQDQEVYFIGSSLLREVRETDLDNGKVTCLRGGTIKDTKDEMKNIEFNPKIIITQIGGNDVTKEGTTIKDVSDDYVTLLTELKTKYPECKLVISGLPPRFPTDEIRTKVADFNDTIQKWCIDNQLTFVNNQEPFELKTGEIDTSVFVMSGATPAVHLDRRGTIRLLENIQRVVPEVKLSASRYDSFPATTKRGRSQNQNRHKSYAKAVISGRSHHSGFGNTKTDDRSISEGYQNSAKTRLKTQRDRGCYNCGLGNHVQAQCRYSQKIRCHRCKHLGHKRKYCTTELDATR